MAPLYQQFHNSCRGSSSTWLHHETDEANLDDLQGNSMVGTCLATNLKHSILLDTRLS